MAEFIASTVTVTPLYIELATAKNIPKDCNIRILVIPTGSLEYHGGLLPYGVDFLIADKLVEKCLKKKHRDNVEPCIIVLPPLPFGYSIEWLRYGATVSLNPSTFMSLIKEIILSFNNSLGLSGAVIVNGHGGNYSLLEVVSRTIWYDYRIPIIIVDVWRTMSRYGLEYCHACLEEAELASKLLDKTFREVGDEYEKPHELNGYFDDRKPGRKGELKQSIDQIIRRLCDMLWQAVELIYTRRLNEKH